MIETYEMIALCLLLLNAPSLNDETTAGLSMFFTANTMRQLFL